MRIQTPRVAQLTGLSIRCIQLMAARGEIPSAAQLGRRWTFDESRVLQWVRERESDAWQKNFYKRGKAWWGRVEVAGTEHRKSLRTSDRATVKVRLAAWKKSLAGRVHFGEHRPTWDEALLRYVQEVMLSK